MIRPRALRILRIILLHLYYRIQSIFQRAGTQNSQRRVTISTNQAQSTMGERQIGQACSGDHLRKWGVASKAFMLLAEFVIRKVITWGYTRIKSSQLVKE